MHHPSPLPRDLRSAGIAFVLTLGLAAWAISSGVAAAGLSFLNRSVEPEVVMLFVPLCALILAIAFEVTRIVARGTLPGTRLRPRRQSRAWGPGHREG